MKILVVGDGYSEIHERAVAEAFSKLGHHVEVFYWHKYFNKRNFIARQWLRGQNKFVWGPQIYKLNRDLKGKADHFEPDLIFIYRGTHITAATISKIKQSIPKCQIFSYNNDDPFAPGHPPWLWRHFLKAVPEYDLMFAYRHHNLEQYRNVGARQVELLRSWFVPWINHTVSMTKDDMDCYGCDVVFIGHYEHDQRVALLEYITRRGWRLRLFGPGYDWDPVISRSPDLAGQIPVRLVWGDDYNRALCGARVALCFLSKLNRDTYTRRCF